MKKLCAALAAVLIASGCFSPSFTKPVERDVVVTDILDDGATIKGRYDPRGFTSANARKMAAVGCKNLRLASYTEADVYGQKVFEATCRDSIAFPAGTGVNFWRIEPSLVRYSAIFSLEGQLTAAKGTLPL